MSKEEAYDRDIAPLMAQIIALCKDHRINMAAQFVLDADEQDPDNPLLCTTAQPDCDPDDTFGVRRINELRRVMVRSPQFAAFTFITSDAR